MPNFPATRQRVRHRLRLVGVSSSLSVSILLSLAGCTSADAPEPSDSSVAVSTDLTPITESSPQTIPDAGPDSASTVASETSPPTSPTSETVTTAITATSVVTIPEPTTVAQQDFVVPRETLISDVASADLVAVVRLSNRLIVDETIPIGPTSSILEAPASVPTTRLTCGYAFVTADATIVEVFKGSVEVGSTVKVGWSIECPFELDALFPGDRLLFANAVDRPQLELAWEAIENTTLEATPANLEVLRSVVIPG